MRLILTFGMIALGLNGNCQVIEKPSWLKTCQIKDPEFTKCSTESTRGIFVNTFNGNFKIEGLDSLDPMMLDKVNILEDSGPVAVNVSLSNVKIFGLDKCEVVENQVSAKDFSWITKIKIPKIRLEADYTMKGNILIISLNGRGKAWFEPTTLKVKVYVTTKQYAKHDHTFFNITNCRIQYTLEGLKFRMSNLVGEDKQLDETINQYLNQNWKILAEALKPIISKTTEDITLDYLQKVFSQLPGDYLVSDLPSLKELNFKT